MISIKINGTQFNNVSKITPKLQTEYEYDVITLDGKRHKKFKGKKTNYQIVFFNNLSGEFLRLQEVLSSSDVVSLTIPTSKGLSTSEYYPEITSYQAKGVLSDGTFFFDGLNVTFDKVEFDELL